ncbi:MAG: hypothetical protein L6V95_08920 [Candidatus Melainabacteria bacterium]|nr:MAG: hypothetical protein L6V95_08920 [Candidatus Melainabacteria bacterium]
MLKANFLQLLYKIFSKAGGVESLASILNRTDRATEKNVMELLELKNPALAQNVKGINVCI